LIDNIRHKSVRKKTASRIAAIQILYLHQFNDQPLFESISIYELHYKKFLLKKLDIKIVSAGFDPISKLNEIPNNPKQRYELMTKDMPLGGEFSLDMMYRTCGTQLNIDFNSEEDFVKKFKIVNSIVPIAISLFANSSIVEKKNSNYLSYRSKVWQSTSRAGLPKLFLEDLNFEKYADFVINFQFLYSSFYVNSPSKITLLIVDNAIPVCDLIDLYEYPSLRNLITKDSFKGLILGLPPRLFPDNFLRKSCSLFLSPKLLSSRLSNSYKILKIEEFSLGDSLAAKKPDKVRNLISLLISLLIVLKHSFLFLNARSS